jgi:hypothetical protein
MNYNVKQMQTKIAIALLTMLLLVSYARADEFDGVNIDTGYFITHQTTTNSPETLITTAGTTDRRVQIIKFAWFAPDGSLTRLSPKIHVEESNTQYMNESGSYPVYYAEDGYQNDFPGYLRVIAIFQDDNGGTIGTQSQKIAVRIDLLNTVPEIQLVGTAGSAGIMLLGLFLYIKKKKQK